MTSGREMRLAESPHTLALLPTCRPAPAKYAPVEVVVCFSPMNPSHPAVKRIGQEARSIQEDPSDFFLAQPLETDLFDWHFTILGPDESAFAGGLCGSFLSLNFCLLHLVSHPQYFIFGAVALDLLVHSHFSRQPNSLAFN